MAAGASSSSFSVTTSAMTASTSVTITAGAGGTTRITALTVNPAGSAGGTLPAPTLVSPSNDARFNRGQTITFDRSDVTGATSYLIQIDNSSTFSVPLTQQQTVSLSRFSTSTLPAQRLWWRVRAIDAAGTPGAWSSVRRIEVR